jgi:hypothetical protein
MAENKKTTLLRFAAWKSNLVSKTQAKHTHFLRKFQEIKGRAFLQPENVPLLIVVALLLQLLLMWMEARRW